ncbi:unnamed protein product [Phyllotreta striolata]|uniref:Uncharacterized protein n=1 Tax=Phyllotreta striolata TaxID=444603 RepID=A0A9N9TX40_PHYSR|nr:unnamed protein product [Phyllotreta striolata]
MATIHINCGKGNLNCSNKNSNVQSVPFKILADASANVDKYFNKCIKTTENGHSKASFRGLPLLGKNVRLPEGYLGVVLHESLKPHDEKSERNFYVTNEFSNINFWNWDKDPSDNDSITQALQWLDVANALHSPIIEE